MTLKGICSDCNEEVALVPLNPERLELMAKKEGFSTVEEMVEQYGECRYVTAQHRSESSYVCGGSGEEPQEFITD